MVFILLSLLNKAFIRSNLLIFGHFGMKLGNKYRISKLQKNRFDLSDFEKI